MNFAVPSKTLEYVDYLLPFELLCRDTKEVLKTRIKDCAFSSFNSCNENGAPLNLTTEEFAVLKSLSKNKNLIIQKSDKGNSIAIIDKRDCLEKMRNTLSDTIKSTQVSVAEGKQLNFIVNIEKHITNLLRDLKDSEVISETVYKSLKPKGSRFGILYAFYKFHKQLVDSYPPFRRIMSTIKTPTYNLPNFLVPSLELITTNMYTVKSSLNLANFSWPVWMSSPSLPLVPPYH